ncbi:MAG: hypothetical protein M3421_15920 [Bacteroidota bacterium]|nr:hypothetical protein [Bacteroidota bacterium]
MSGFPVDGEIFIDDEYQRLNFPGYEVEEDEVWCYLQIVRINSIKDIAVFDNTLFENFFRPGKPCSFKLSFGV